jgi:hypothetical protein
MLNGNEADVIAAINSAKSERGPQVGCPEVAYATTEPILNRPSREEVVANWENIHRPGLAGFVAACPSLGREWASAALGAYYARRAGQEADLQPLSDIAQMMLAQQYGAANVPTPLAHPGGIFAYLRTEASDPCFLGAGVGEAVESVYQAYPDLFAVFDKGLFAGKRFLVADTKPEANFLDGGMAFDQGWAGVMMIEAASSEKDEALAARFRESAFLAGDWALAEPPVRNHNYTAKLIWLLAELYAWTGESKWRAGFLDKIGRNLKPGILMDLDEDGFVDGMEGQPFNGLSSVAQRPGRMWDGHNARPVYHAMNAWALVEAYSALRDHHDSEEAAALRPYALAMLDNLAWEINHLGVPSSGLTQMPIAMILGILKIARPEGLNMDDWEKAANALWNAGAGRAFPDHTTAAGLYLLYASEASLIRLR